MANNENLKKGKDTHFATNTSEEQARIAKEGGIASGEAKRASKLFKEAMTDILDLPITPAMLEMIQKAFNVGKGVNLTLKEAMIYAQVIKAISDKDTQAFNAVVDRVEGKPQQFIETSTTEDIPVRDSQRMKEIKKLVGTREKDEKTEPL